MICYLNTKRLNASGAGFAFGEKKRPQLSYGLRPFDWLCPEAHIDRSEEPARYVPIAFSSTDGIRSSEMHSVTSSGRCPSNFAAMAGLLFKASIDVVEEKAAPLRRTIVSRSVRSGHGDIDEKSLPPIR